MNFSPKTHGCSPISFMVILVFGFLSKHLKMRSLISSDNLYSISSGNTTGEFLILSTMFFEVLPLKGKIPVTNAYKMHPIDQTSKAGVIVF